MKFANKCIKNEKTKNMFPLRVKDPPMEIREEEVLVVYHANTEKLKKSEIPYMQRLLNKNKETSWAEQSHTRVFLLVFL